MSDGRAKKENPGQWPVDTLMARLSADTGEELLALARPMSCPAGEALLSQGEPSNHVYLLGWGKQPAVGCVKVTAASRNGNETMLGIRVSGDIVGELGALRQGIRSATVTTCHAMTMHAVPLRAFRAFLKRREEAWVAVCRMIADRLDWANRRRLDFAGYDVAVRLARVILELADRHGRPGNAGIQLGIDLSQAELGMLIGARPDTIGLAVRQLKDAGFIKQHYRTVTILDLKGLHVFADPD